MRQRRRDWRRAVAAISLGLALGLLARWVTGCGGLVPAAYYLQGQQRAYQMPTYYGNPYDSWPSRGDEAIARELRAERLDNWARGLRGTTCNPNYLGGFRCF